MARARVVEFLLNGVRNASTDQPLASGKVYTYDAGTSTPRSLYTNSEKSSTVANPFILGADGCGQAYADGSYKFIIKDSADVTKYTYDNLVFGVDQQRTLYAGSSSGGANTYNITISPNVSSAADLDGMVVTFLAHQTNTGGSTINVNGIGGLSIVKQNISTLFGGEIIANQGVSVLLTSARAYILGANLFTTAPASYTPTYTASVGNYTPVTTTTARWSVDSNKVFTGIYFFSGTTTGATTYLRFTLPNGYLARDVAGGGCRIANASALEAGFWQTSAAGSNTIDVARNASAAYTIGAGNGFLGVITLEIQ